MLAHMGGNMQWDEVEEYLVGKQVYFDTGVVLGKIPDSQFLRIAKNHGTDKILFATDSPWAGQREFIEYLRHMELSEDGKEQILWKNGASLLGMKTEG